LGGGEGWIDLPRKCSSERNGGGKARLGRNFVNDQLFFKLWLAISY